jgi:aspartokinase
MQVLKFGGSSVANAANINKGGIAIVQTAVQKAIRLIAGSVCAWVG